MTFLVDGTLGGTFPSWTTATRPASPAVGQMGYNTTTGLFDQYVGSAWQSISTGTGAVPQVTTYSSGSGTYTTPTNAKFLVVQMVGGGGGGSGGGVPSTAGSGGTGGTTTFGTSLLTAPGGGGGSQPPGGAAGALPTGGDLNFIGSAGEGGPGAPNTFYILGGSGGSSYFGGQGLGGYIFPGYSGYNGSGGGGGGLTTGSTPTSSYLGGGGASGGFLQKTITSPLATYAYSVGAGGTAGTTGTNGYAGGAGGAGFIVVTAYF